MPHKWNKQRTQLALANKNRMWKSVAAEKRMPPRLTTWWLDRQEEALKTKRKTRNVQSEMSKIRSAGDNKNKKQQKQERERKKEWKLVAAATECVNNKNQINSVTRNTFTVKTALQLLNWQRRRQSHKSDRATQTYTFAATNQRCGDFTDTGYVYVCEYRECEHVWVALLCTCVWLARQLR